MSTGPGYVINKGGGFFTALVKGIFGTIAVLLVCATAVGLYGMRLVDRHMEEFTQALPKIMAALPEWQKALPPAVAEAFNDHRALEYRDNVRISARVERSKQEPRRGSLLLEVENTGKESISVLAVRAVVQDEARSRAIEVPLYVATPIMIEGEWRGPLQPGEKRILSHCIAQPDGNGQPTTVSHEITELRVWSGPLPKPATTAPALPPEAPSVS